MRRKVEAFGFDRLESTIIAMRMRFWRAPRSTASYTSVNNFARGAISTQARKAIAAVIEGLVNQNRSVVPLPNDDTSPLSAGVRGIMCYDFRRDELLYLTASDATPDTRAPRERNPDSSDDHTTQDMIDARKILQIAGCDRFTE